MSQSNEKLPGMAGIPTEQVLIDAGSDLIRLSQTSTQVVGDTVRFDGREVYAELNRLYTEDPDRKIDILLPLLARVATQGVTANAESFSFFNDKIEVLPGERKVLFRNNPIKLSPIEYGITTFLGCTPGKVHETQMIVERVWGDRYGENFVNTHTVNVHIGRLRHKFDRNAFLTHRSVGYSAAK